MNEVVHVVLGAALVTIGVLVAALADRVRGLRIRRRTPARDPLDVIEPLPRPDSGRERTPRAGSTTQHVAADVIAALVAAGHKKPVATEAVWDCRTSERTTIADWTRAALRRCAREGLS